MTTTAFIILLNGAWTIIFLVVLYVLMGRKIEKAEYWKNRSKFFEEQFDHACKEIDFLQRDRVALENALKTTDPDHELNGEL
jgi:hypothetical protein